MKTDAWEDNSKNIPDFKSLLSSPTLWFIKSHMKVLYSKMQLPYSIVSTRTQAPRGMSCCLHPFISPRIMSPSVLC